MTTPMTKRLRDLAKVGAAGAAIFSIGWAILVLAPDAPTEGVAPAKADIWATYFAPTNKGYRFVESLYELGMEEPRVYNYNGNRVFFTMKHTSQTPAEVLYEYQTKFEEKGINKKAHVSMPPPLTTKAHPDRLKRLNTLPQSEQKAAMALITSHLDRMDDFFGGGVIPTSVSKDYISMAGAISEKRAENAMDFLNEHAKSGKSVDQVVDSMKHIEIIRNTNANNTLVTAMWSDDKLDIEKFMDDAKRADLNVDTEIPACIGCERVISFQGESEPYGSIVYAGRGTVQDTVAFYKRALPPRGYKVAKSESAMAAFASRGIGANNGATLVPFQKVDGTFLSLLVYPDEDGRTVAHLMSSP